MTVGQLAGRLIAQLVSAKPTLWAAGRHGGYFVGRSTDLQTTFNLAGIWQTGRPTCKLGIFGGSVETTNKPARIFERDAMYFRHASYLGAKYLGAK